MLKFARAAALAAAIATGGILNAGSAMSAEIVFGDLVPAFGSCSYTIGGKGLVCDNGLTFTASGTTFTATGFNSPFAPDSTGAVTLKLTSASPLIGPPLNIPVLAQPFNESGIGENAASTSACSDPDCEIAAGTGVAIVATRPMNDAIIGSVQTGESFNFFTGSTIAGLSFVGQFVGGTCTPAPGTSDTCLITFPDAAVIGVQTVSNNVLVTAVSGDFAVPEPASMALLGSALLGFGLLRRRRA